MNNSILESLGVFGLAVSNGITLHTTAELLADPEQEEGETKVFLDDMVEYTKEYYVFNIADKVILPRANSFEWELARMFVSVGEATGTLGLTTEQLIFCVVLHRLHGEGYILDTVDIELFSQLITLLPEQQRNFLANAYKIDTALLENNSNEIMPIEEFETRLIEWFEKRSKKEYVVPEKVQNFIMEQAEMSGTRERAQTSIVRTQKIISAL